MGAVQTRANAFLFAIHYYIATPSDDLVYNIVLIFYHFIQVWLLFEHCKYTAKNQTTKFFVENFLFFSLMHKKKPLQLGHFYYNI
ncbi:hypothetical protein CRP19_000036 [Riemerella phage vB_RanS_CRP19]|nr:hypothetical protein CRP5_000013 [Riemerella phage vB_RanS_CRP5]WIT94467.1 hypothetical protein CRP19_000036 [Riemerella phage vB_RanS_CRP19]